MIVLYAVINKKYTHFEDRFLLSITDVHCWNAGNNLFLSKNLVEPFYVKSSTSPPTIEPPSTVSKQKQLVSTYLPTLPHNSRKIENMNIDVSPPRQNFAFKLIVSDLEVGDGAAGGLTPSPDGINHSRRVSWCEELEQVKRNFFKVDVNKRHSYEVESFELCSGQTATGRKDKFNYQLLN